MKKRFALSNDKLLFSYDLTETYEVNQFQLVDGSDWKNSRYPSGIFSVVCNSEMLNGQSHGVKLNKHFIEPFIGEAIKHTVVLEKENNGLVFNDHTILYPDTSLIEKWLSIHNDGNQSVRIDRVDSVSWIIPADNYEIMYYTSAWGEEFEGIRKPLNEDLILQTRKGRSSLDQHPWFTLFRSNGELLTMSVMWSGNWVIRFEQMPEGGYRINGGLHDWNFHKILLPGESMECPHVAFALGTGGDLNETSVQFARVGRKYWYPKNSLSSAVPVEWNHWWSYEDNDINEDRFKENISAAAMLGVELCTLDAGWFGPTDNNTNWYDYRGDWDLINSSRFPNGIKPLSEAAHSKGLKFGLWCEIEALGKSSSLGQRHPDYVSRRAGENLGYVCFGNPDVQEWAFQILDRLITEYHCDWIKLDFNLDPCAGCNREDHGHGPGDGLYEHYMGYYKTLARIRHKHPEVVLENCSSGGLRIDLGMLRQTHITFLSDPDWPVHSLQTIWGSSTMLAPEVCLHWSWSEWISSQAHPKQTFNPRDPLLSQHQLDYYIRISMLGCYGFSQKLPELPEWVAERIAVHTEFYKRMVRAFVKNADLYRLTEQPKRNGSGERWAAFQYAWTERNAHLLFTFRLDRSNDNERTIRLRKLHDESTYKLTWLQESKTEFKTGQELKEEGIHFQHLQEEDSAIILIQLHHLEEV